MLTHVHTSSTLCGYQVGSKGKVVVELEEKEALVSDRTLARPGLDSDQAMFGQCVALG